MAAFVRRALERRDDDDDRVYDWDDDDDGVSWWYSDTGYAVKWSILGAVILLFTIWVVGGYLHAKKRIEKGLPPMGYHRCFVSRRMMARVDPRYAYPSHAHPNYPPLAGGYGHPPTHDGYQMYSMPPPVYDPSRPPMYEEHGTKIDPVQGRRDFGPSEYQVPPGPPPPRQ